MADAPEGARRRLWISLGEAVAIVAVIIAALNYWDSHRQHEADARAAQTRAAETTAASALVLEAELRADGRQLLLRPADPGQVIQSQRYVFPGAVLGHPMEVVAAPPQIDADWIAGGLAKALDQHKAAAEGEARVPVAILTRYMESGVAREDRSLYSVGFAWRRRFLGSREIRLQGVALRRRLPPGDPAAAVNAAWTPP